MTLGLELQLIYTNRTMSIVLILKYILRYLLNHSGIDNEFIDKKTDKGT